MWLNKFKSLFQSKNKPETFVFDLDGTLCDYSPYHPREYKNCIPHESRIEAVNKLYDSGHTIVIFTARGMSTETPYVYKNLTEDQLKHWGVKYHSLKFGKPSADHYIDDKAVHSDEFFKKIT